MSVISPITVATLIELLKLMPQGLPAAYRCMSETVLLDPSDLQIRPAQPPRPDGWVHDQRPDKEAQDYLVFPGN